MWCNCHTLSVKEERGLEMVGEIVGEKVKFKLPGPKIYHFLIPSRTLILAIRTPSFVKLSKSLLPERKKQCGNVRMVHQNCKTHSPSEIPSARAAHCR